MIVWKWLIYVSAAMLMMHATPSVAEDNEPVEWLEISRIDFDFSTMISIPCETFGKGLGEQLEKFSVYEKKDIERFSKIVGGLTASPRKSPPDTRAKVLIHYKDGHVNTLCVSYTMISLNGKLMEPDKEIVRFIEQQKGAN